MTPTPVPGIPSRLAAAQLLAGVLDRALALDTQAAPEEMGALSPQDRAFALRLAKTALRRLGQTDVLLAAFLQRPLPANLPAVRHALRLGITQLFWMDIPAHAAVHSGVELMKALGHPAHAALANAVLNRAAREGGALLAVQDAAPLNTPGWLWESWLNAYGEPAARRIAAAHLAEPPLDLSVKENPAHWAQMLGGTVMEGNTVRIHAPGPVTSLPGYEEGAWWVQDAAAALPARLLAEALGGLQGKQVADLCAAPGGKTAQLIAGGARVTAVDHSPQRMKTLHANLARLNLSAESITANAAEWQPPAPLDGILLDAPCSATGTLRRHPDVARLRKPEDVTRLAAAQSRLLRHACALLPPGAPLVYSVCSLQPEEGERQMEALQSVISCEIRQHRLSPGDDSGAGDGFFVAMIRKKH